MFRNILAPTLTALLLATTAMAGPDDKVAAIDVLVDLPAITNPAAALRYTHIADDLKAAIAARLDGRMEETGITIGIDVSEVELSNSFTDVVGSADTRLVGNVTFSDLADNSNSKNFELTIDVNQAKAYFATGVEVMTLSANSNEFYRAMIDAFAEAVVARLNE